MPDLILKNCKTSHKDIVNIIIENEKIKSIKKTLSPSDITTDNIINIKENIIIPGLIDPHVHFRDPGLTKKEDWKTGSQAAVHGGYTTVIDMPNTIPPTDTLKNFKNKKEIALKKSVVDFGLHAGVKTQKDVLEINKENPASYKIFMDLYTPKELEKLFSYIPPTNKPLSLHCEDRTIINHNIKKLKQNPKNDKIQKMYSYARSTLAEVIAVNKAIELAKKYQLKLHLCHITSKPTLELIDPFKKELSLSVEITPHHLFLDNTTYDSYGSQAKTNPPLRDKHCNLSLKNINQIDSIGTDHAPHTLEEKNKNTWTTMSGIPGLEITLKLLLTEVNKNKISLEHVENLVSKNPAKIFNIPCKGQIKEGFDADITVINMKKRGKIDLDTVYTKGKYTPFENREYKGTNIMTISRGNIIVENNEIYKNKCKYIY